MPLFSLPQKATCLREFFGTILHTLCTDTKQIQKINTANTNICGATSNKFTFSNLSDLSYTDRLMELPDLAFIVAAAIPSLDHPYFSPTDFTTFSLTFRYISVTSFLTKTGIDYVHQIALLNVNRQRKQTQLLLIAVCPTDSLSTPRLTFRDKSVRLFPTNIIIKYLHQTVIFNVTGQRKQVQHLLIARSSSCTSFKAWTYMQRHFSQAVYN